MPFFRIIFFIVLLLVVFTVAGVAIVVLFGDVGAPAETKRFSDRELGISFWYPTQWKKEYAGSDTVRFSYEQDAAVLTVKKQEKENPLTLEEYTKENLKEIGESAEHLGFTFVLKESAAITLSGNPAHRLISLMQIDGKTLHVVQVWSIASGRVYSVSFSVPAGEEETAVKTLDTLIESIAITH